jgi:hypothetical protein
MSDTNQIRYLSNLQINKTKWDECITHSSNGLIYGYSFYLDTMATHWDALVLNDYEAVMPLTWKKKFGIKYLFQPFLTAQLGVFGNRVTEYMRDDFFKSIPSSFWYIDISLNSDNILGAPSGFNIHRSNYTLDLSNTYENIYAGYSENIKRNIKKSLQAGCSIQKGFDVEKVIELAVAQMNAYGKESKENVDRFRTLYQLLLEKEMATTYGVFTEANVLFASCVFFFSHNRAYYILVGNNPEGRDSGASHALIDAFIKDNAGKNLLLDFEGSDIPSLASFYRSFGAIHEPYPALKINRLPFFLKWLKK